MTLRQTATAADAGSLLVIGKSLIAIHDWTFLLGPGFADGIGTGLILGYLMYRSGLVSTPHGALRSHRRSAARRFRDRRPDGCHPAGLADPEHRDHPGDRLGAVPGPVAHLQGLQGRPQSVAPESREQAIASGYAAA